MIKKTFVYILLIATLSTAAILVPVNNASAHRDGCHRWHSCPSDSGSYVCGDLGYTSGCGTSSTIKVRTPVKTTKVDTKESVIRYKTVTRYNPSEYSGYKKVITPGATGISISKSTIQLTDGVEVSRSNPTSAVSINAIDEVIEVGNRAKPVCKFTKITEMKGGMFNSNKGKYIAEGFCVADTKIVLYQNDKKVSSTKTNKDGYFEFKKLKRADKPSWLTIYDKKGNKGTQLSEKTLVTFTQSKYITEYNILRKI